jgi:hypothetical protein
MNAWEIIEKCEKDKDERKKDLKIKEEEKENKTKMLDNKISNDLLNTKDNKRKRILKELIKKYPNDFKCNEVLLKECDNIFTGYTLAVYKRFGIVVKVGEEKGIDVWKLNLKNEYVNYNNKLYNNLIK